MCRLCRGKVLYCWGSSTLLFLHLGTGSSLKPSLSLPLYSTVIDVAEMRLATTIAWLIAAAPLAVRAEGFWVGVANCETGECSEFECSTSWDYFEFLSENEPGCNEFYNGRPDTSWDWDAGSQPGKFTEILCDSTIDFYQTDSGYDFYFSGGDGTKLGSCYYDTGSNNGPCPFGNGSCAVKGVLYCNSNVQLC